MRTQCMQRWIGGLTLVPILFWAGTVSGQTFSSGSTGADGAFAPTATTTLTLPPNGVFNFTTVNIPSGVTVTFAKNAANTPVTMLATGAVTVAGTISVNGTTGANGMFSGPLFNPGAPGGPGGFAGGQGGARDGSSLPSHGHGPGGGPPATVTVFIAGSYGAPASFVSLLPLFGGSGGGGASAGSGASGASGGGGGGAIVIASSSSITVNGTIQAKGGDGGGAGSGGSGSGGAIRLVATQITGTGTLNADGGTGGGRLPGRIRLEAFTLGFSGTIVPASPTSVLSTSTAPGPVTASSTPALINLPTLTISSVGGGATPATPGGSYTTADVSLPPGTTNPVPVIITANNIPVGTVFTVRLLPQFGAATSVSSFASTGTFATSTATANVNFPTGQVSVLNAFGSFTLPQIASLFPLIDGEEVERIMVAAAYGERSILTLMTKSGREVRPDQLPLQEQVELAQAFDALAKEQ
ncbi:MAG: hypothetical protein ACREI2_14125 [Nitrospiraceae bacterium]